ncbi:Ribonuclease H1 [Eufriesea mexicana]|uniref:Ribonuclease H n=1 Tax=Eufriesea mexicana TaxID=516756 RepID=A0A310ST35_9HYME|nr:Ribonuclease H1 [Eufriesea mexicana]
MVFSFFLNILKRMPSAYYAVARGRKPGIYKTWDECKLQVDHFTGAKYKKFHIQEEAENFIKEYTNPGKKNSYRNATSILGKRSKLQNDQSSNMDSGTSFAKKLKKTDLKECSKVIQIENGSGGFNIDSDGYVNVYTDGACSSNGRTTARAGIGVWFGDDHPLNVSQAVVGRATNNMAEIQAVTIAAKQAKKAGIKKLKINTDSKFLISCINNWMPKWKANGWNTAANKPVINKIELLEMEEALKSLNIIWADLQQHPIKCEYSFFQTYSLFKQQSLIDSRGSGGTENAAILQRSSSVLGVRIFPCLGAEGLEGTSIGSQDGTHIASGWEPALSSSRYCYKRDSARGVRARSEGGIARGISKRGMTVVVKRTGAGRHARGWYCTMVTDGNRPGLDHGMTSLPRYQDTKDQRPMKTSPSPRASYL